MARWLWPLLLVLLVSCATTDSSDTGAAAQQKIEQLETDLTARHPAGYLQLADALWQAGQFDKAVVMFYVGQIRYRAYINTLPEGRASLEEQRYDELKAELGEPLNQYAARNLDRWVELIDRAIAWHRDNPSSFLPKDKYKLLYDLTLYDYRQLREYIINNKALIRQQRAAQGLENE